MFSFYSESLAASNKMSLPRCQPWYPATSGGRLLNGYTYSVLFVASCVLCVCSKCDLGGECARWEACRNPVFFSGESGATDGRSCKYSFLCVDNRFVLGACVLF